MPVFCFPNWLLWMGWVRMDTQNLWFKVGPIWDSELWVWDAKNFGPVSPGTHRNKFVKKTTVFWNTQNYRKFTWFANQSSLFLAQKFSFTGPMIIIYYRWEQKMEKIPDFDRKGCRWLQRLYARRLLLSCRVIDLSFYLCYHLRPNKLACSQPLRALSSNFRKKAPV